MVWNFLCGFITGTIVSRPRHCSLWPMFLMFLSFSPVLLFILVHISFFVLLFSGKKQHSRVYPRLKAYKIHSFETLGVCL